MLNSLKILIYLLFWIFIYVSELWAWFINKIFRSVTHKLNNWWVFQEIWLIDLWNYFGVIIRRRASRWVIQIFNIFKYTWLFDAWQSKSKILFAFFIWINTFLNLCINNKLFARSWGSYTSESLGIIFNHILTLLLCIFDFFF